MQTNLEQYLNKIAEGDQEALKQLYEAVSSRLFGIVLRILKNRELAEDALQEIFIKIWNRAHSFDVTQGAAITWLNSLARNQALDMIRRSNTRASLNIPIKDLNCDHWENTAREYSDDLVDFEALVLCLEQLHPETQSCIVGMYCEGHTQEELSETLQRPVGTVKSWIRRGLVSLKGCLDNEH